MQRTLEKLRTQSSVTIVNIGDSVTVDTPWTFGRKNWVQFLAEALWTHYGDGFIWVINSAKCGTSFPRELERLEVAVLRFQPDLVMLQLQMGDDLEAGKRAAREIVRRVRENGAEVLLRTLNPVVHGFATAAPEGAEPGEAFDGHPSRGESCAQATRDLAAELGCALCDHYALWKQHRKPYTYETANPQGLCMRMADTVHPGPIGHLACFRDIAPLFGVPKYFHWEEVE